MADAPSTPPTESTTPAGERLSPLDLYQRFISSADGQRCPMHPTCSHYARQAFDNYNFFTAWILICDRLLRCGRDETRLSAPIRGPTGLSTYDPLKFNTNWWDDRP